ncbi:hypothetical protein ACFLRI_03195 [Bacteroidota bacterium]
MRRLFYLLLVLTIIGFESCNQEQNSIPEIKVTNPDTRAPLYYNGDSMFLYALLADINTISSVRWRMEDKDLKVVYEAEEFPFSKSFTLIDTIPFHVNDHTNYILYISAENEMQGKAEYSIFIHVMP